jgi:uncharacterized protein (DUF433 family)
MQLEDYFEFEPLETIKLKGHRIWLHDVVQEYVFREMTPNELLQRFPTLDLEQIFACLLYYHRNKEAVDRYIASLMENQRQAHALQSAQFADLIERMRKLKEERSRVQTKAS